MIQIYILQLLHDYNINQHESLIDYDLYIVQKIIFFNTFTARG